MPGRRKSAEAVTTVLESGEVILPASILASEGWGPGTELEVLSRGDDVVLRRPFRLRDRFPAITWEEFVARRSGYNRPYVTDEMMRDGIEREARRRWNAEDRG